jgi:Ca2+-binding RTX toxin-like protein
MTGTAGADTIQGKGGIDVIHGGAGNDVLIGGADRDWMTGEGGDDRYVYASTSESRTGVDCDVIWGFDNGNDRIDLSKVDANSLVSGVQAFKWVGGNAFTGQAGELRSSFDGADMHVLGDSNGDKVADFEIQLNGTKAIGAESFILGSATVPAPTPLPAPAPAPSPAPAPNPAPIPNTGATPAPTMAGSEKQDIMRGTGGVDVIHGKGGIDVITAGSGNDVLVGGANRDWLSGQGGNDTFVFTSLTDSRPGSDCDVICDWGFGTDRIDLRLIDANTAASGDQAFKWIGASAFSGQAGELRAYSTGSSTIVEANVDGDKGADLQIQINGKIALAAIDFLL